MGGTNAVQAGNLIIVKKISAIIGFLFVLVSCRAQSAFNPALISGLCGWYSRQIAGEIRSSDLDEKKCIRIHLGHALIKVILLTIK
jgi:hypothetical protein